ncbi:hypothetical protein CLOSTMETH_01560 [[Clostridium] methylpentosum DSM 5476]|uniref:Uncharacterized protein n=1 Tax=[Clostridium] methylpentosum DSM 5476 TaxID=537013 RepID=C0ECI9_9FIRM|nr:hypothetical protein CLOSTMETH_01560 [[Clostridium] methylpentosum DSM 5476]
MELICDKGKPLLNLQRNGMSDRIWLQLAPMLVVLMEIWVGRS